MSTDIKLSKTQITKMIRSSGSLRQFREESTNKHCYTFSKGQFAWISIPLAKDNLPGLVSNLTSNAINKFERKISGKGAVRAGEGFTLPILNEGMSDVKIIKSLKDLGNKPETVKHEIKKKKNKKVNFLKLCQHHQLLHYYNQ